MTKSIFKSSEIQPNDLHKAILKNLEQYKSRNVLECFALLFGKAQILEFGMKNLLKRESAIPHDKIDRWALGTIATELAKAGIREDYIAYLRAFTKERNYIAHEMLANNAIMKSIASNMSSHSEFKQLFHPSYNLERLLIIHDWLEENNAWRAQKSHDLTQT